ncbi:YciI family protein [Corallococcus exiguus]|uniref:YciI family protein n=1 Tax=Corallococcus exiguus TaxID=83462 RepID=UPI0014945C90|nr:YciI family protein [Corallococcus exiguus]NPC68898.1 YciI family protein [Corallococcus exiguus]NPD22915.1 YciI family protein [Corallococcus exiguus]NRD43983.1 YciI family protein [Corallococcus exiguus]
MRFMMIVKANSDSETGRMPSTEELTEMGKYNEELVKAGILLAGEGLHPSSKGARVAFSTKGTTVTDGPFSETKELIAGFWIIEVKSREEAIAWARRIPFKEGEVEIRQVASAEDFAESDPTGELRAKEEALRVQVEAKAKA